MEGIYESVQIIVKLQTETCNLLKFNYFTWSFSDYDQKQTKKKTTKKKKKKNEWLIFVQHLSVAVSAVRQFFPHKINQFE